MSGARNKQSMRILPALHRTTNTIRRKCACPSGHERAATAAKPPSRNARILEQIANCPPPEDIPPALPAMLRSIVEHMTALTERGQIRRCAIPRIVIEMRTGEDDIGGLHDRQRETGDGDRLSTIGAPAPRFNVPPASVAEMSDPRQMRSAALFTSRACTIEAYRARQLRPVDRIEPAVLGADRHGDSMNQCESGGKGVEHFLFWPCPPHVHKDGRQWPVMATHELHSGASHIARADPPPAMQIEIIAASSRDFHNAERRST